MRHNERGLRGPVAGLILAFLMAVMTVGSAWAGPRERLSLDEGWSFLLGDVPLPQIKGHGASYANAQTGQADGPRNADFDDSEWRRVKLPRADRNDGRAHLVFREIVGKAEVWVDGVKLGEKTTPEPGPLRLPLAEGPRRRTLTLLLESQPGRASGVIGSVLLEPGTP